MNTSFNENEPIVNQPEEALDAYLRTDMDVLVMEDYVLLKREQPAAKDYEVDEYLAQFQLD